MAKRTAPAPASDESDLGLAARAAWLSYIGGYTQQQIADRLHVSQAKAHRLIADALRRGLVKVFIQGVPAECARMEDVLRERFGLATCMVAPSLSPDDDAGTFAAVGAAGARMLYQLLTAEKISVIGVGKGRTLAAVVQHLPDVARPDLKVVAVSGSLTRSLAANPLDIVLRLSERTGGEGYFLPVPYLAPSEAEKQVLLAQKSVGDMLQLARRADLVMVGIGSLEADAHLRQIGMLSEREWSELRALGAVGDLMGSFIDEGGRPVAAPLNRLSMGLGIQDLKGRRVVGLAGGARKARAILAALRTGALSDLVIDEEAAAGILKLLETATETGNERSAKGRAA